MIKLATAAAQICYDKKANLAKFLKMIDEAADNKANLIVFAEQGLQGYLTNLGAMHGGEEDFGYQYANAETIPDGECVSALIAKAKERKIHVIWGMTERDPVIYHKLYNSTVLAGPDGYIGSYRKVHQPFDELHIYYRGTDFPVYDTAIGKIGMMICYDKCYPESAREMCLKGADILVMPTAWPFANPNVKTEEEKIADNNYYVYDVFDKVRAMENQCFFISSNQYSWNGDHNYMGSSSIVSPWGRIVATTGFNEGIAYYETESVQKEVQDAKWKSFLGLNFLKDRNPDVYKNIAAPTNFCNTSPVID